MTPSAPRARLDVEPILPPPLRQWSRQLEPVFYRLFVPAPVDAGLSRARQSGRGAEFARALLEELNITFAVDAEDRQRLPAAGPAVIVANHPYGIVEGLILAVLLDRVRWRGERLIFAR